MYFVATRMIKDHYFNWPVLCILYFPFLRRIKILFLLLHKFKSINFKWKIIFYLLYFCRFLYFAKSLYKILEIINITTSIFFFKLKVYNARKSCHAPDGLLFKYTEYSDDTENTAMQCIEASMIHHAVRTAPNDIADNISWCSNGSGLPRLTLVRVVLFKHMFSSIRFIIYYT